MSNTYISISASDYKYDKIGRNDQCPCGSGKKFKKCCLLKCEDKGE